MSEDPKPAAPEEKAPADASQAEPVKEPVTEAPTNGGKAPQGAAGTMGDGAGKGADKAKQALDIARKIGGKAVEKSIEYSKVGAQKAGVAAAKAHVVIRTGMDQAKKKFDEAGGVEGVKQKTSTFIGEIKKGFHPDADKTGFKAHLSRVPNLWKSGTAGKSAIIATIVVLLILVGGNDEKKAQRLLDKGRELVKTDDAKRGVAYIRKSAKLGNPMAQVLMYAGYRDGGTVDQDMGKAVSWLKKAAKQKYPMAVYEYARLLGAGTGVKQDTKRSAELLEEAAEMAWPAAASAIADAYANGAGVEKDLKKAVMWSHVAKGLGDPRGNSVFIRVGSAANSQELNDGLKAGKLKLEKLNKIVEKRKKAEK